MCCAAILLCVRSFFNGGETGAAFCSGVPPLSGGQEKCGNLSSGLCFLVVVLVMVIFDVFVVRRIVMVIMVRVFKVDMVNYVVEIVVLFV